MQSEFIFDEYSFVQILLFFYHKNL
jgi:hypothetical protein